VLGGGLFCYTAFKEGTMVVREAEWTPYDKAILVEYEPADLELLG
jgi:hypothetical protein